ncbi:hypothetical protein [Alicyclobacillus fastidiosus]|uniref:Uncharacterized protein n=1 Tax=Alicyclobacillus fastidiosus TaxID=392011 RepID=A0ABV5AFA1_9BACL|nr:hypothetical protein [Alicyclobacillus fastidiosus]WEH09671.1 hypothetical protein PYS47_24045 [Alicyclobacillus fastidiosus]
MSDTQESKASTVPLFELLYDHLSRGEKSPSAAEAKARLERLKTIVESEARRVFEERGIALPTFPQQTDEAEQAPQPTRNRRRLVWPRHNG